MVLAGRHTFFGLPMFKLSYNYLKYHWDWDSLAKKTMENVLILCTQHGQ